LKFSEEVKKICKFLNMDCPDEKIISVARTTSLNSLREKYNDDVKQPFFRKGEIGDWKNYLDRKIIKDINKIKNIKKLPLLKPNLYRRIKSKIKRLILYDT